MLVDLLKSTSLLVTISAAELMSQGQLIASETFRALEVYLVIAALYFALCYPLSQGLLWFERQIRAGVPLAPRRRRRLRQARALLDEGGDGMSTPVDEFAVRIDGLVKSFDGREVLKGVSLEVRAAGSSASSARAAAARRRCCAASTCSSARTAQRCEIAGEPVFARRPHGLPRPRAPAPDGRDGVPALQPVPAPDRGGERDAARRSRRRTCPRPRRSSAPCTLLRRVGLGHRAHRLPRADVGRRAAARRDRPRARAASRPCCCSTSRPPRWTPSRPARCCA